MSASQAVLDWGESRHLLPGIVTVMHTFGSRLNFNPHIHMISTLGGYDSRTLKWKSVTAIPYQPLKAHFKVALLHYLRREFKNGNVAVPEYVEKEWMERFGTTSFYRIQNELYGTAWYLWVGEELDNVNLTVGYIGRYAKRPSLAETRITYYSKENNIVKFTYRDKITKEDKLVTLSVNAFIGLLIRHIPEQRFHMIRYAGAYANARMGRIFRLICVHLITRFGIANLLFGPPRKTWRQRMIEQTGTDPLKCPDCGITMSLTEIHYRVRDGTMKTAFLFS